MKTIICFTTLVVLLSACTKDQYDGGPLNPTIDNELSSLNLNKPTTVRDIDNNIYHIKAFGSQIWMLEDLKTTHFNDGSKIWDTIGHYSYYTITTKNLCPLNWHVPEDWEWHVLADYFIKTDQTPSIGGLGYWWSATGYDGSEAIQWYKNESKALIYCSVIPKERCLHVRCIKD